MSSAAYAIDWSHLMTSIHANVESMLLLTGPGDIFRAARDGDENGVWQHLSGENRVGVNAYSEWGMAPLHEAALHGQLDIIKVLETNRCDSQLEDLNGNTALHLACLNGNTDVISYLIDNMHLSVNSLNEDGKTPLHLAAAGGNLDAVKLLVQKYKVDTKATGLYGRTALHDAVEHNQMNVMETLVENGTPIHARKHDGYTALHIAAEATKVKDSDGMVMLHLVRLGANIYDLTDEGKTALQLCNDGMRDELERTAEESIGAKVTQMDPGTRLRPQTEHIPSAQVNRNSVIPRSLRDPDQAVSSSQPRLGGTFENQQTKPRKLGRRSSNNKLTEGPMTPSSRLLRSHRRNNTGGSGVWDEISNASTPLSTRLMPSSPGSTFSQKDVVRRRRENSVDSNGGTSHHLLPRNGIRPPPLNLNERKFVPSKAGRRQEPKSAFASTTYMKGGASQEQ